MLARVVTGLAAARRSGGRALGLSLATVALASCGQRAAPPTSALPVIPGARVIASAADGSTVDSGSNHNRYRYMAISGRVGESGLSLLESEPRYALAHGWSNEQPTTTHSTHDRCGVLYRVVPAPITAPGVIVSLDSLSKDAYAAMLVIANPTEARQLEDGSPLYGNAAIDRAFSEHRPVLAVTLGPGKATRASLGQPAPPALPCPG